MGIITKEVEIKVNGKHIEYYKSLGYEIPMKRASKSSFKRNKKEFVYDIEKFILVKVEDLPKQSHARIYVLCDSCEEEMCNVNYRDYCNQIEKYGSYMCPKCVRIHREETCMKIYGAKNPLQNEEIRNKANNTIFERYGVYNISQSDEIKLKKERTFMERYNVPTLLSDKDMRKRITNTMLLKYGVEHALQNPVIEEKKRRTNLQKYGCSSPSQLPEVRAKMNETLYKNNSQKVSTQQFYLHNLYGGELNYPIKQYNADICFPQEMIYCEYNGGGHNLSVKTGKMTQEEFNQKELVRSIVIKREGYKQMTITSQKDKLPSDQILLQMLQDARTYFNQYPNHSWIEFSIDNSTVRNAENKDGLPYSFGELRTISKSEVSEVTESIQTT